MKSERGIMSLATSLDAARPSLEFQNIQTQLLNGVLASPPSARKASKYNTNFKCFVVSHPFPGRLERDVQSNATLRLYQENLKNVMVPWLATSAPKQPLDSKNCDICDMFQFVCRKSRSDRGGQKTSRIMPGAGGRNYTTSNALHRNNRVFDIPNTKIHDKMLRVVWPGSLPPHLKGSETQKLKRSPPHLKGSPSHFGNHSVTRCALQNNPRRSTIKPQNIPRAKKNNICTPLFLEGELQPSLFPSRV